MASRSPRAVEVVLSVEERAELSHWVGGAVSPRVAERARIILACADGASNTTVAAGFGVSTEDGAQVALAVRVPADGGPE